MKNINYTVWGWSYSDQDYNKDFGVYESEADAIAHADIVDNGKGETIVEKSWENENGVIQSIEIHNNTLNQ